jgi:hypothetical protein
MILTKIFLTELSNIDGFSLIYTIVQQKHVVKLSK